MLKATALYANHFDVISTIQVENEPIFPFGTCKPFSLAFLSKEIETVRALTRKPFLLTDAGEIGYAWPVLAMKSDIFGTTLYRYIHHPRWGYFKYWFVPSEYFQIKSFWTTTVLQKKGIISELQAEPWELQSLKDTPREDLGKTMSPEIFDEVVAYARRTGFSEAYFWGVEYWYWLQQHYGDSSLLDKARLLF